MKISSTSNRILSVLFAVTVTVSILLSSFCQTETDASDETVPDYSSFVDEMIVLVNEARTEAGLKPLYAVPMMNNASLVRAHECVDLFDHYRPDGSLFITALDKYQISYYAAAENIAAGGATAEATFNQWKNSPNHWKTIMNENYTHIGVGVYYQADTTYGWYWEQLFIACDEDIEGQYLPERYAVVPAGYGDIDGDGNISSLDFVLLLKLLKKEIILNDLQIEAADCMYDGTVTIADAIVLRKYLLCIYDALPRYP